MLTMDSIMQFGQACNPQYVRNYSNFNINKFHEMLSYELWDDVFTNDNVNNILNEFLNAYLNIFYSCLLKKLLANISIIHGLFKEYELLAKERGVVSQIQTGQ
jgi:hypothetical protein